MQAVTTALISALLVSAGSALADWPTDPATPLFVGPINNGFDERAGIRSGSDGSVWLAWQEAYCQGDLLLQHVTIDAELLAPNGLVIQDDPTCGFHLEPAMVVIDDSIVVARGLSSLFDTPVQGFSDTGSALWGDGFTVDEPLAFERMLGMDNGDVLLASRAFNTLNMDRLDGAGNPVWAKQLVFDSPSGANFDILSIVPDGQDGGYVFWQSHVNYVMQMYVMRVSSEGETMWDESVRLLDVLPPDRGASRHTHSEMVPDGQGGAIFVYSEGFEQGTSPAALLMQRVLPDGSLSFEKPGVRVSMGSERQFDVDLEHDPVTGDALITWRDGFLDTQSVRAQRMNINGDRLWGEEGIELAPLTHSVFPDTQYTGSYDSVWVNNTLKTAVGAPESITLVHTNASGSINSSSLVGTVGPASFVKAAASYDGVVISWQVDGPLHDDLLVAQRVNRLGQLGGASLCPADLTGEGVLDFFDVSAFLNGFTNQNAIADFNSDGQFNFFDVSAFLAAFSAGCP